MRNISRKAALAFRANKPFRLGNTEVDVDAAEVRLFLHGHCIAYRNLETLGSVQVSLAGWGTPTTRERANGLLKMLGADIGFYQHKHEQYLGDKVVDSSDWNTVATRV